MKPQTKTKLLAGGTKTSPIVKAAGRLQQKGVVRKAAGNPVFQGTALEFITQGSYKMVTHIRAGVPSRAIQELSEVLAISRASLYEYVDLSKSTIEKRIKEKQPLSKEESDRVVRVAKTYDRALAVFEDRDSATRWMKNAIRSLGGVTPLSLLDTEAGYELVMDTLGKIEFGVVA